MEAFFSVAELVEDADIIEKRVDKEVAAFEASPLVEDVFMIRVVNPLTCQGKQISIVLYEPEMVEFFPELKSIGIDFKGNPDGCILGSRDLNDIKVGDMAEITFSKGKGQTLSFPVVGHVTAPYKHMSFSQSSTIPTAGYCFSDGAMILMQATDERVALFDEIGRMSYNSNYFVVFKDDVSLEDQQQLLSTVASSRVVFTLDQILENSDKEISETLKTKLMLPVFLMATALVAYLSTAILTFKKKEKDLAIFYLCGCSRKKCTVIIFAVFNLIALPSILFNALVVFIAPYLEWLKLIDLDGVTLNSVTLVVILVYYLITAAIAYAVTVGSMSRHSPVSYLRGVAR